MADLSPTDFGAYFKAIHGHAPFPWQERLCADVARTGEWPKLLDLPTGAGKTAAIDVALFHLALDAGKAPRRIVLVVDRRTVVDQAFGRARNIRRGLDDATNGVAKKVADRLRALSGGDTLAIAEMRGGMPRDDGWTRRPDLPVVAISTVDQVGSRLLFRGYGLSESMRPIHAGLLGNDALILLDEVHLSRPFQETLKAIEGYRKWTTSALPNRWQFVQMSATPGSDERPRFELDDNDRGNARLAQRLGASKPAKLDEPVRQAAFAEKCAEHAAAFAAPGRVVGVVVNRVATAQETCAAIRNRRRDARVFLVTGRMRPLDRDDLDAVVAPLARSGRERDTAAAPVVVVSTQCIEAGADFDFDALVTECASLDALRQRFGRLNRLGDVDDARGVVLVRSEALGKDPDPIYGEALRNTWEWLGKAPRDFGIDALKMPNGKALDAMLVERTRAPVMLPAHLDLWAQTNPAPQPDPDVSLWLHGIDQRSDADVHVVWRADMTKAMLDPANETAALDALLARVEVCPPVALEALAVPVHAARAWLAEAAAQDLADVEGRKPEPDEDRRAAKGRLGRRAVLWRGSESKLIDADGLRPGMTILVPSTYGGLTDGTWDPTSRETVSDLGDRARWKQTGRPTLRLDTAIHPSWPALPTPVGMDDADTDDRTLVGEWLAAVRDAPVDTPWLLQARSALGRRLGIVRLDAVFTPDKVLLAGAYLAVIGRGRAADATTEDDGASHTGVEVPLHDHMKGVADWARSFGVRCGLPEEVARDLELAGRWHDAGKVDPRFQRMLHGGSAYKAEVAREPLAKSSILAADRATRARARERAGYPKGARHELASVALLQAHAPLLAQATDADLVLHLVASHHGHCRPFAPAVADPEPVELALDTGDMVVRTLSNHDLARLDAGVPERFWRLVERYGWFGLAWLEAILRLADHRRSEEEQTPMEDT